jgi:hypothetical protein
MSGGLDFQQILWPDLDIPLATPMISVTLLAGGQCAG